tara:strand:- start:284 stop:463 length:180 start_codon:yes stop_codon:yes gene_type:complete
MPSYWDNGEIAIETTSSTKRNMDIGTPRLIQNTSAKRRKETLKYSLAKSLIILNVHVEK